jgi:purine nucleosidase
MIRVWLDTDVGDDIDDLLALAYLCASPGLGLAGVSTVLGETDVRARLARTFLARAPGGQVPAVHAGSGAPLPGLDPPWDPVGGPVSLGRLSQRACALPARRLPAAPRRHAVDAMADAFRTGPVIAVTIGPLTNLASMLLREPALAASVPRVVAMAGEFRRPDWEWNVRCDPLAAACVADSGMPVDWIPWDIGMKCTVSAGQLRRLMLRRTPRGRILARAVRLWRAAKGPPGRTERPHLFDPMAVASLLHPGWFTWRRGRVRVSLAPESFGRTVFTPDARGPHRIAWDVDRRKAVAAVWARILSV